MKKEQIKIDPLVENYCNGINRFNLGDRIKNIENNTEFIITEENEDMLSVQTSKKYVKL